MSNLFKYKIVDADTATEEKEELLSPGLIPYLAFVLVCTIMITVFSTIVMILDYCFPGSLDGTYLKLFF
ncbi:hypothetical protein C7B62_11135 [Pleurocapsa sp. CCALA 161]|nr:hypothetical protein C7B62_11135 [Pleurocapsa sp. CCALA 161]